MARTGKKPKPLDYFDEVEIRRLYVEDRKPLAVIAIKYGIHTLRCRGIITRAGITIRKRHERSQP